MHETGGIALFRFKGDFAKYGVLSGFHFRIKAELMGQGQ